MENQVDPEADVAEADVYGCRVCKQARLELTEVHGSKACLPSHENPYGAQTYNFLSSSTSSSCSTESGEGTIVSPGVVQLKVTLFFFCGPSLSSCSVWGLLSALCFQRRAQLLTTRCICCDLFGRQKDSCLQMSCTNMNCISQVIST